MSKRKLNTALIFVSENEEGEYFANVDATDCVGRLQPTQPYPVGHGMTLRGATINLLDKWKANVSPSIAVPTSKEEVTSA